MRKLFGALLAAGSVLLATAGGALADPGLLDIRTYHHFALVWMDGAPPR